MTMYDRLLELYPEYCGAGGREAMIRDGVACPERHSEALLGYEQICDAERRTPGLCRACQRRFLGLEMPAEASGADLDSEPQMDAPRAHRRKEKRGHRT